MKRGKDARVLVRQAIGQILIYIKPAERPFNRIDLPVLIVIKFLEMVLSQIPGVGVLHAGRAIIWAGIIPSGIFQQSVIHEIGPGPHVSSWTNLFAGF